MGVDQVRAQEKGLAEAGGEKRPAARVRGRQREDTGRPGAGAGVLLSVRTSQPSLEGRGLSRRLTNGDLSFM